MTVNRYQNKSQHRKLTLEKLNSAAAPARNWTCNLLIRSPVLCHSAIPTPGIPTKVCPFVIVIMRLFKKITLLNEALPSTGVYIHDLDLFSRVAQITVMKCYTDTEQTDNCKMCFLFKIQFII